MMYACKWAFFCYARNYPHVKTVLSRSISRVKYINEYKKGETNADV